jgi:hypothetical protein
MNEFAEPMVVESESILPAQFFPRRRDETRMDPFRKLALAVLVDAVHVFQTNIDASRPGRRREFNETREWLLGPPGDGPFAFANVCFLLEIDPSRLRNWLVKWQALKRAGRPCKVLPRRSPVHPMHSIKLRPPRAGVESVREARGRRRYTTETEVRSLVGIQ